MDVNSAMAAIDRRLAKLKVYRADSRPLVKFQSILAAVAILTAALFFLTGTVELWHENGGRDSAAVGTLEDIVVFVFGLVKVLLIGVLLVTVYLWFSSRRNLSSRS